MSSFSESHTSHGRPGRARHQIRDRSESGRSRELLTPGTSDSCRPRGVVTRDFSAIFGRLFDRLPVRILTSDLHHWILRKKVFHIRAYDFGVQFSFKVAQDSCDVTHSLIQASIHASHVYASKRCTKYSMHLLQSTADILMYCHNIAARKGSLYVIGQDTAQKLVCRCENLTKLIVVPDQPGPM